MKKKCPLIFFWPFCLALAVTTTQAQTFVRAWLQRYHGPGIGSDMVTAMGVDQNGNVFVTGYSYATNGTTTYATLAYSKTGVPLWTNLYNEPVAGSRAEAYALAVDNGGNVFVTGVFVTGGASDYSTIKYSAGDGTPLWTNRYRGPGTGAHAPRAITVDTNGNVFVTGRSQGPNIFSDYATIAYSSAGAALWTNRYDGPINGEDFASAIALDPGGNILVTGGSAKTTMSANYYAFVTIKYSATGVPLWTNRFALGAIFTDDRPSGIAVDGSGNVFVTGYTPGGNARDFATVAYSGAGAPLWTNRYTGPGDDFARAIAVDGNGNVYVAGSSSNGTNTDHLTIAYSNAGVPLWTNRYNGPGNGADVASCIAVHTNGNVFVTGYSAGVSSSDYVMIEYSNSGVPISINRYDVGLGDQANDMALDGAGNVFLTGDSFGANPYGEFATIKCSLSVPLTVQVQDNQLVLRWTNTTFALQTAPAITGIFTNLLGATSPYTNTIDGAQQFFRLISN